MKDIFLTALIFITLALVNLVFINGYWDAFTVYREGERMTVKALEVDNAYRGFEYKFSNSKEEFISYSKTEIELNLYTNIVMPKNDRSRVYIVKGTGSFLEIFNGLIGNGFMAFLFILMHFGILRLTLGAKV